MHNLEELEKRIGYIFQDKMLLKQALTHSSFANEQKINRYGNYERLEFLGDAVLELVSSDFLFHENPDMPEGKLTRLRSSMVCEPALAYCARDLELETYILNQPEDSRPILLERDISAHVSVSGRDISLFGRIDRMDRRKRGLVVLDYKTGTRINNVHPRLWTMDAFFEKVQDLTVASTLDATDKRTLHELFLTLRENAKSIQLPCYVTICTHETRQLKRESMRPDIWPDGEFGDAAFVALASKGEEIPIDALKRKGRASDEMDERHRRILSLCPKLVELVVLHMQHTEELVQMRDPVRCGRCSFAQLCLA